MTTLTILPSAMAREAIEILEQAYGYYMPEPVAKHLGAAEAEYFEYAPAA
ncbi:hypothetical protein [Microbulbifer sp. S227A]